MIFALNNLLPWFLTLTVSGRKFPRVRTHLHQGGQNQTADSKIHCSISKVTQAFPVFSRMVGRVFQCLCYHLLEQFSMGELQYWKPTRRRIWLMEGRKVGRGTWASLPGRSSASCYLFHQCSPEDKCSNNSCVRKMLFSRNSTMEVMRKPTSLSPTYPDSMREFFSNAWNMSLPQSWYVLFPVKRHRYRSDSTVSGLKMFHDVPTLMSYGQ